MSLNYALFLPLAVAKPKRLPAESSAGHHGDFHSVLPKAYAFLCFSQDQAMPRGVF